MKPITEREQDFKSAVQAHLGTFPQSMLTEFYEYWTEPNKSGSKMKFELEKTWDLKRRLHRWANNGFGAGKSGAVAVKPKINTKPQNEIEELDEALMTYQKHPSHYEPKQLAKWYNLLVRESLMRKFTKEEVVELKQKYGHDPELGRGVCVMQTFLTYANSLLTFGELLKAREKIQ